MPGHPGSLRDRLTLPEFPRSARYDPAWMVANAMGPNPLWLLEDLTAGLGLEPGMRVLDLRCGKAMTSIFLAQEFGVSVHAADLWIKPSENWRRITEAGCADRVVPVLAEAHQLPFAEGFFDAVVSVDAYHYFGTDALYVGYLASFVRPGGRIAVAVPGLHEELDQVPDELRPFWEWAFVSFHAPPWWRRHWQRTGQVEVERAEAQRDGWRHWQRWCEVCAEVSADDVVRTHAAREAAMLAVDQGRRLAFVLVSGRVPERAS